MFKIISAALFLLVPYSSLAATVASFDLSVDITLQTNPGQELVFNGGGLPAPTSTSTSGDASIETSDDGNGTSCCSAEQLIVGTDPQMLGAVSLSAEAIVNSVGSAQGNGERRALLNIGNFGAAVESVTLIFDVDMNASQAVDPLVGGGATSGGDIVIQRDGIDIFEEAISSSTFSGTDGDSFTTRFVYMFDLLPVDDVFTTFRFSLTGDVLASSDPDEVALALTAVPLPASGVLLLAGCFGLWRLRRKQDRAAFIGQSAAF